ncbi:MAG: pyrroloquinoline quinone-dependent dehydrogenase [Rhodothermales bacterium]
MTAKYALAACLPIAALAIGCSSPSPAQPEDWPVYRGDAGSQGFSSLAQIDTSNVARLELAWTFEPPGDERLTIECNPIVIDGVLYALSPGLRAFALDAATGAMRWFFDPDDYGVRPWNGQPHGRGLTYWADGTDRRLFYVAGGRLFALDAGTGRPVPSFGENGSVDFKVGIDRDLGSRSMSATSPGAIFEDLLIIGSSSGDGILNVPPGDIRAFNVRTGALAWVFRTVPRPGEYGYDTWSPDAWKHVGGVNNWSGMSLDPERGVVYVPTGSATYDHNGSDRIGVNLFANTLLALDARTGERIWHFQAVHHDLWDYDLPSAPTLVDLRIDGQLRPALAQTTKMGHLFVLDRVTGEPIFPVEERPVPQSAIPGEQSWPTQPFPTKPPAYARQGFTEADITDLTPEATADIKARLFDRYGPSVLFQPPTVDGAIYSPQFNGGTDWGGGAVNPATGMFFVNASNEPETMTMQPAPANANHDFDWVADGHIEVYDPEGFPISKRPWGTMNGIDLNAGEIVWQVPLGTYPELEARGLPPTGTFNIGGPIATAGGLVFIGATRDERIRAFHQRTGEVLWEYQLPAGGYATPATYAVDGRQYVVIAAGGGGKAGTKQGNAYLAFALPEAP